MRLSKIKLAGFKSFVDPTTVHFPTALTGIVGPNGCGKSNVIDAVRWVMGESSAKNLRGESMADVVFNGSSTRKPVGTASIELVFDNSDGTIGGQYAQYNEVSIKRQVSRDGASDYFLNGVRCRRKDITHIFLGTGLGPRSYSIIEQGMISRLVEAKPDELRNYLEEAAGISKYKDRRRETEHRIRHTRENLERLNDLRDEVEKQIRHLQRQARTAERYRELKQEEKRTGAELLALKLREIGLRQAEARSTVEQRETRLQSAIADLRAVEASIERTREVQVEANDGFNEAQGGFYKVGAEIARLEQTIHHGKEMRQRQQRDLEDAEASLEELREHIERDQQELAELESLLARLEPDLQQAARAEQDTRAELVEAESERQAWQESWESFARESGQARQTSQVERARIEQLESQLHRLVQQRDRLAAERDATSIDELAREIEKLGEEETRLHRLRDEAQSALQSLFGELRETRDDEQAVAAELDAHRGRLQEGRGRMASLQALQQAALGKTDEKVTAWLEARGLGERPRLAQTLRVDGGWETAVETVLGDYLQAVCVDGIDSVAAVVGESGEQNLAFAETGGRAAGADAGSLAARVEADVDLSPWLAGVRCADDLDAALRLRPTLGLGESVITRDGIWIGTNWLRIARARDARAGVLARAEEIRRLEAEIEAASGEVAAAEERRQALKARVGELEAARDEAQAGASRSAQAYGAARAAAENGRKRLDEVRRRREQLEGEAREVGEAIASAEERLKEARGQLEAAVAELARLEDQRQTLEERRERVMAEVASRRERHEAARRAAQEITIKVESRRSSRESASVTLERMRSQYAQFSVRQRQLTEQLAAGEGPLATQEEALANLLEQRVGAEKKLAAARHRLEDVEAELRELDTRRTEAESRVGEAREALEEVRMRSRELDVRRENLAEQFAKTGLVLEEITQGLAEDASVATWEENLARLGERIQRLGPINLAAIDEFREQSERKAYLDAQNTDLTEALETLENAIRKIDRETRTRFKETYDRVNSGLGQLFPRLFGGGHATLELTGEDLLESGVTVMARPPGKRNSSIHLLSGGEKALTAVALVFSIFQLNPAPFCLLDEVDAPLDDANVGRFCDIVREMSERVQFIFITHNKVTMEMANQLTGVTMNEPGVSRLVAVDIDEAVKMAAM